MMRGLTGMLEKHHRVRILDEAVIDVGAALAAATSPRASSPTSAMSVLDTACARVAIGQQAIPAAIEDLRRRIDSLDREEGILVRETAVGTDHDERIGAVREERDASKTTLAELEARWEQEKALVAEIHALRGKLEGGRRRTRRRSRTPSARPRAPSTSASARSSRSCRARRRSC